MLELLLPAFMEKEMTWVRQALSFAYPDITVQDLMVRRRSAL